MTTSDYNESQIKWLKVLKISLIVMAIFDLTTGSIGCFFPEAVISFGSLNIGPGALYPSGPVEPVFLRGVGVLWIWAAYIQFLAWKYTVERPHLIIIAMLFRFLGGTLQLFEIIFLLPAVGFGNTNTFLILGGFVFGDYLLIIVTFLMMKKLDLKIQFF